ncbi:MAG: PQQ-binding-like beta-propeller repeat protein [bacterium]
MIRIHAKYLIRANRGHAVLSLLMASLLLSATAQAVAGSLPEDYQRYELTLRDAHCAEEDMTLHLNYQDGRFLQGWVDVDGKAVQSRVDASELALGDGAVRGTVDVVVDGSRFFAIDIDAEVDDAGKITGDHEVRYGWEGGGYIFTEDGLDHDALVVNMDQLRLLRSGDEWSGPAEGTIKAAASVDQPVRFRIDMGRPLRGPAATWHRVVILEFIVRGDEVISFDAESRPGAPWTLREIIDANVSFDGNRIEGEMTIDIDSAYLHSGEYDFAFEADVQQNLVSGETTVYHEKTHGGEGPRETTHRISGRAELVNAGATDPANAVHRITFKPSHGVDREMTAVVEMKQGQLAGVLVEPIHGNEPASIFDPEVSLEGDRLHGSLLIDGKAQDSGYPDAWGKKELAYEFDLRISDGKLAGDYDARYDRARQVAGAVTGRRVATEELRAANPAPEVDWPTWHGPRHTLSAAETDTQIIDNLSDARTLWKSERTPPARAQIGRYGTSNLQRAIRRGLGGGGASVVVHDGRIYLYYFEPSGEASVARGIAERRGRQFDESWKILADDVVLCIDLETGATLWKRRFEQTGLNLYGGSKNAPGAAVSVGEGKVFAVGSAGKLWAMDAENGEVLWESTLPAFYSRMQANREESLEQNTRSSKGSFDGGTRIVVDGLLVGTDYAGNLVGIDTETGEKRWRVDDVIDSQNTPSLWQGHDEPVVVVGNGDSISAVSVADGELLWRESRGGTVRNRYAVPVEGDYLATFVSAEDGDGTHVAGFRITTQGLERLWTLDKPHSKHQPVMIHQGHAYSQGDEAFYRVALESGEVWSIKDEDRGDIHGGSVTVGVGNRLIVEPDTTHSGARFLLYDATDNFRLIDNGWRPPIRGTSGYYKQQLTDPVVDGRLVVRGANGIYLFDLRDRSGRQ